MNEEYWKESIEEIADELKIDLDGILDEFVEAIMLTAELESEYTGNINIENPLAEEVGQLKEELKEAKSRVLEAEWDFRQNVARRHNCDPHDVTLLGDGSAEIRRR